MIHLTALFPAEQAVISCLLALSVLHAQQAAHPPACSDALQHAADVGAETYFKALASKNSQLSMNMGNT